MAAKLLFLYLLVVAGLEVVRTVPLIPRQSFGTLGTVSTGGVGGGNSTASPDIVHPSQQQKTSALSERVIASLEDLLEVVRRAGTTPLISRQFSSTAGTGPSVSPESTVGQAVPGQQQTIPVGQADPDQQQTTPVGQAVPDQQQTTDDTDDSD